MALSGEGAVEEGDHLGAVADGVGAEGGGGQTAGEAVFHRPEDRLIVEVRGLDIHKGIDGGAGFGLA